MEKIKTFSAKGLVYGNYWGGGTGSYKANKYYSETSIEDLREQIKKAVDDESIDSGMGYESIIGALMIIKTTTTIVVDDKPFKNEEVEMEFFGDLSENEQDFLIEVIDTIL